MAKFNPSLLTSCWIANAHINCSTENECTTLRRMLISTMTCHASRPAEDSMHKDTLHCLPCLPIEKLCAHIGTLHHLKACSHDLLLQVLTAEEVAQRAILSAVQAMPFLIFCCQPASEHEALLLELVRGQL